MAPLRFKDYLVVAGGIALVSLSLSIVYVNPVSGEKPMPVTITNTPLQVTGATTVSGSVAATQSGAWNVGVTGTARVANVNDPGRTPFQRSVDLVGTDCSLTCAFTFGPVPSGKRLVLEQVSGALLFDGANTFKAGACVFAQGAASSSPLACFNYANPGDTGTEFVQPLKLYFDAGQTVLVNAGSGTTVGRFQGNGGQLATVSGYLVDCSAAPCAAIAP